MLLGAHLRRLREAQGVTREDAGWEIRSSESKISRMELGRVGFKERDVAVSQVHARNDLHTMFREFVQPLPGVDTFTKDMICIPIGFWVGQAEREQIVQAIKQGW